MFKDPLPGKPWTLSEKNYSEAVYIPDNVAEGLKSYHILAIDFLYQNYRKKFNGSILNQEVGMNFPLQISAFLGAVANTDSVVLVICSSESYLHWHYHLACDGNFSVIEVTPKSDRICKENITGRTALLVVENDNLQLCEDIDMDFFSVVIENLDKFARKRIVKQLKGKFNIGLTVHNFYIEPDQALQWNMLHWANPGCVGQLGGFYEVDNTNLKNLSDNYYRWWMRLTWNFSTSFVKPTYEEDKTYNDIIKKWAFENSVSCRGNISSIPKKPKKRLQATKVEGAIQVGNERVRSGTVDDNAVSGSVRKNVDLVPCLPRPHSTQDIISSLFDHPQRSDSEEFIISLLNNTQAAGDKSDSIKEILETADAALRN